MPRLTYNPEKFGAYTGAAFAQPSYIDFTWSELCKCAMTVGRPSWADVFKNGPFSIFELSWRLGMLFANLKEDATGALDPSPAFRALDPSEKGAVSYFLGICFTKLVMEKLFGVPWLLHFDVYRKSLNPNLASDKRPDFVGLDTSQQWTVVEAKGRSWSMPDKTMETAKSQSLSLLSINGQSPALSVAVGVYFAGSITARIWDPDEHDNNAVDEPIDPDLFLRLYYEPLVVHAGLLQTRARLDVQSQKRRRSVELNGLDATLLVDDDIVTNYARGLPLWQTIVQPAVLWPDSILAEIAHLRVSHAEQLDEKSPDRLRQLVDKRRSMDIGQAADGVTIELGQSWRTENMRRNPADRND